jgi:uncharacterized protein DUF6869
MTSRICSSGRSGCLRVNGRNAPRVNRGRSRSGKSGSYPERAWPVYDAILRRKSDDETLYQVGARVRILLWRFFDPFIDRMRGLFERYPRLWRIVGDDALDRRRYTEAPYDRAKLIEAYQRHLSVKHAHSAVKAIMERNPRRGIAMAIEIIHRGPKRALQTSGVDDPLGVLLLAHGQEVIEDVERAAQESVLVRRALWSMVRAGWRSIPAAISERLRAAAGTTTEFTDDLAPWPLPRRLEEFDERLVEAWLDSAQSFWAWEELADMVNSDPDEAWEVTRALIESCPEESELFSLAAGPLEDLLQKQPQKFDAIASAARESPNVRHGLAGVWMFPEYEAFEKFEALLAELGIDSE